MIASVHDVGEMSQQKGIWEYMEFGAFPNNKLGKLHSTNHNNNVTFRDEL